jgi:sulfur carrier protein
MSDKARVELMVNGAPRTMPAGSTVRQLLEELDLDRDGIAVAVNRAIVPRSQHGTAELPDRAQVEVIRAVGGG